MTQQKWTALIYYSKTVWRRHETPDYKTMLIYLFYLKAIPIRVLIYRSE